MKEAALKSLAKIISKNLTPQDLEKVLKKIDTDGNGNLDKSEMKGLVEEAGVANMSDRNKL